MKKNSIAMLHSQLKTFLLLSEDCIIILDANYCIIDFNKATRSLLHWNEEEMIGEPFESLYRYHPNKTPFPFAKFEAIHRGECFSFDEILYQNKSNRHITWKFTSPPDRSFLIILGKDNTNKKRLALNNITFFDQIKKISAGVLGNFYWKNKEKHYLGCNQTFLQTLGLKATTEIIGKTDLDLWPENADSLKKNDERVLREKKNLFFEETVTYNGKIMFFRVIKMPLLDDEGNIIGILGNSLDIISLKKTHADLNISKKADQAASQAKTEFIANMSHDIRTPLTGVVGIAQSYLDLLGSKILLSSKKGEGRTFSFDLSLKIGQTTPNIGSLHAI